MHVKNRGSALVMVLVFSFSISLLALGWWRKISLGYDVVLMREEQHRCMLLVESVFSYGISIVKSNADSFLQKHVIKQMPVEIDLSFLVQKIIACYAWRRNEIFSANLQISLRKEGDFRLVATLQQNKKTIHAAQGILKRDEENRFFLDYYTKRACTKRACTKRAYA